MQLTVRYPARPKSRSAHASLVMDHFGLDWEAEPLTIADDFELPLRPGDIALFTGDSGSGKSSLMRAASDRLSGVVNVDELELPDHVLADALPKPFGESLRLLSACGLGEAPLLLRTPAELSDGQRYRFRLALGLSQDPEWLVADEFTATLDRTLARVVAFNLNKLCRRRNVGALLATTHDDILSDLDPSLHIRCALNSSPCALRPHATTDLETVTKKA